MSYKWKALSVVAMLILVGGCGEEADDFSITPCQSGCNGDHMRWIVIKDFQSPLVNVYGDTVILHFERLETHDVISMKIVKYDWLNAEKEVE